MIEQRLEKQLITIGLRVDKVEKIILFGSRAVGDHKKRSDIDLAFVAPDMARREWIDLTFTIEDELDTLLLLDIVKLEDEDVSLQFKKEIIKNGKVLYSKLED
ncbi:nucleotidyltransferase domain-containing protein [Virgibacillus necropolis]|uniref:Polymerase beta nucleotidyltransferase domain-containing protein n=1 Tax=Virgibacillus necropolis TaxID=163877 RepID=A0A221M8C8_9BACI|nr:nucleotidyltransferase domain-containing protein [Virgibacillus necropolis]ASN03892.1 hypothetical protein CFK40_02180 [Virgibacillus necropolis]